MTRQEFIDKAKELDYSEDQITELLETIDEANSKGAGLEYDEIVLIQQAVY